MKSTSVNQSSSGADRYLSGALLAVALAATTVSTFAADAPVVEQKSLPVALVDALNILSGGPYAGYRANHAKGVVVEGLFEPANTATSLSKAPQFSAKSTPVLVRFSNGTGLPTMPDADPHASPHGIAIRFNLPDGSSTDIVSISAKSFPVATPEDFLALLQAISRSGPTASKPTPIEQFLGTHPAAAKWVSTPRPAPVSFGTLAFYGINAFKFTNANGVSQYARYQILPVAGEHALSDAEVSKALPNYLMAELPIRIAQGPVKFRIFAQLAKDGDPINDASVAWPSDRVVVELGTISLTATVKDQVNTQKALLFNPVALPDGIEPSDDPILLARFPTYAVSFGQRAQ